MTNITTPSSQGSSPPAGSSASPASPTPMTIAGRSKQLLSVSLPVIVTAVTAAMFVVIIASIFWPFIPGIGSAKTTLLRELAANGVARGLITFLVAVATVGIALVLTVYAVTSDKADLKENFAMAKEILSGLIGVLGTIVGFYFGSTTTAANSPPVTGAQVSSINAVSGGAQTRTSETGSSSTISSKKPPSVPANEQTKKQ